MQSFTRRSLLLLAIVTYVQVAAGWQGPYPPGRGPPRGHGPPRWKRPEEYPKSDYHDWNSKEPTRRRRDNEITAGVDRSHPIDESGCTEDILRKDPRLSSPVECARTCYKGQPPKTCYYHFVVERYPVNGLACQLCTPNITNHLCSSCQCVLGDGVERSALTVNRMIPGPTIQTCEGDHIVVDVQNKIKGVGISIHWHGVFQKDYQYYDGVPFVTQCPINEQNTFRYQFAANNAGTHFWHAHTGLQKMDGIFGSLIIRRPASQEPNSHLYNWDLSDHVVVVNDWFTEESTERFPGRNSGRVGQLPDSILINGKGRYRDPATGNSTNTPLEVIKVKRKQSYRFRLVNSFCTVCSAMITIQGHNFTVVETDGQNIRPVVVNSIISFAGERYSFVVNTNQPPGSYWIQIRGMGPCQGNKVQQLALLQYEDAPTKPMLGEPSYDEGLSRGVVLNPIDGLCENPRPDAICISDLESAASIDPDMLKEEPDMKLYLPLRSRSYKLEELFKPNTYNKFMLPASNVTTAALIDGISFAFPSVPPISQYDDLSENAFCNSKNLPRGCAGNCTCPHMIHLWKGAVIEIFIIDEFQAEGLNHPFHLHGHAFHVMSMGQPFNQTMAYSSNPSIAKRQRMNVAYAVELDRRNEIQRCWNHPAGKDTIAVPNNGFVVLRFRANNPGYWLFHCHFVYHQMVGMDLIFRVGHQRDLPPVPPNFPRCGHFTPPIDKPKYDPYH